MHTKERIYFVFSCAHKSGHKRYKVEDVVDTVQSGDTAVANTDTAFNDALMDTAQASQCMIMNGSEIFKQYASAVFMVFTTDGSNVYQGSGFFIDSQGLAVSNYHVFKGTGIGDEAIKLPGSDQTYKVSEIYTRNEQYDFIIFRVDCGQTNYIPLAPSKPEIGDKVYAIGSPRGLENTFSSGEVSQWRDENLMQINALIDYGSSGGALINEYGQVVGITSGTFYDGSQANLNYAWSIEVVKPFLQMK